MIGWYTHHHGLGHLRRAQCVIPLVADEVTVLSSLSRPDDAGTRGSCPEESAREPSLRWVALPRDDGPPPRGDVAAGGALHWAPLRHAGMRARSAYVAEWAHVNAPTAFVVDVSVEMLTLARLLSVPPVAVALRGTRTDRPHALGYDVAELIIAPWPEHTQQEWPTRWANKTVWTGGFSRFDRRTPTPRACHRAGLCVLVLLGSGGDSLTWRDLVEMAAVSDTHWHLLSDHHRAAPPGVLVEKMSDPWPLLCQADVVVSATGNAAVNEIAAARKPMIAVAQPRPFDEQVDTARALAMCGLAVATTPWPTRAAWPGLLGAARQFDGSRWRSYADGHGAARFAAAVDRANPTGSHAA